MGRIVSGLGGVGYGIRCDLSVHALKVRPPTLQAAPGVIVFSQQHDKILLPVPTGWLAALF